MKAVDVANQQLARAGSRVDQGASHLDMGNDREVAMVAGDEMEQLV